MNKEENNKASGMSTFAVMPFYMKKRVSVMEALLFFNIDASQKKRYLLSFTSAL